MSVLLELYETKLELVQKEEELQKLKEEYSSYRKIVESTSSNKKVKDIKKHISWMSRAELNERAREMAYEEWIEGYMDRARRKERLRREEEEEKKRAAERKALDELMEKERRNRARKDRRS